MARATEEGLRLCERVPLVTRALLSGTLAAGLTGAILGLLPIA